MRGPSPSPDARTNAGAHAARSILVVQTAGIGDALLTTPALRALRARFPGAAIDVVSKAPSREVFEQHPAVREVRVLERTARSTFAAVRWARARRFELLVDFTGKSRTAWIALLGGIPTRLGHGPARIGARARVFNIHGVEAGGYSGAGRLGLLRGLGVEGADPTPEFRASRAGEDEARALLAGAGIAPGTRVVALAPASAFESKTWPRAHWLALAELLAREHAARVVAVVPPDDRQGVAAMGADTAGTVSVFPASSLSFLAALYARAALVVADCSGPRHLAVSQGTPTVTVHGGTDESVWTHPDARHRAVGVSLECRPCFAQTCRFGTTECLARLDAAQVARACAELLDA
jgi:ADP-heptose:LPS heptosyltransferase